MKDNSVCKTVPGFAQISVGQILGHSNIFKYIWTNIFIRQNIFADFFWCEYIRTFIRDVFILTNIFGYSFIHYLWQQIHYNFHLSLKKTFAQHSLADLLWRKKKYLFFCSGQCGMNIWIFEYIQIYLDKYIHSLKLF